jgi:hypothetical protein
MARLNTLLFLVVVALSVVALIDCLRTERSRLQSFPRGAWTVLILLCPVFGALAWFRAGRAVPGRPGPALVPAAGPIGPEDDPEFVRMLAETVRKR